MWYLIQPEQRAGKQERAHFVAPVVIDERAPVLVFALARVGVLVKVRAVEEGEAVPVFGEMRRHPVDDDARARPGVPGPRSSGNRPACRGARWARSSRWSDSPTNRRKDAR